MKLQTADLQLNIRDYGAADFDRLWQIDQTCFPDGIAYTQMELSGFIMKRNAIILVAEFEIAKAEEGGLTAGSHSSAGAAPVCGFVVAHLARSKVGRILTLDIIPEARRVGLASRLMQECEQRLRAVGCTEIFLETAVNNTPALNLYRKLGYEVVRILPQYYSSHSLDAFLMAKTV